MSKKEKANNVEEELKHETHSWKLRWTTLKSQIVNYEARYTHPEHPSRYKVSMSIEEILERMDELEKAFK